MCARFTLVAPASRVADMFGLGSLLDCEPLFNIAPTQTVLTVRAPEGRREFANLRWGLVPSWAKDLKIGNKLLNARSETVAEKPSFRSAFKSRRCLIVTDGFYEWRTENGKKQPYHIHFSDRGPFAFAGLWERWPNEAGESVETCSILTTAANKLMQPIHDRMPVILSKEDYARWLNSDIKRAEELNDLFVSESSRELEMFRVTPKVNKPGYHESDCILPI